MIEFEMRYEGESPVAEAKRAVESARREQIAYYRDRVQSGMPPLSLPEIRAMWYLFTNEKIVDPERCPQCMGAGKVPLSSHGYGATCQACRGEGYKKGGLVGQSTV